MPDISYKIIDNMINEFQQISKEKLKEKIRCYRDLPKNHEEQQRKRFGNCKKGLITVLEQY